MGITQFTAPPANIPNPAEPTTFNTYAYPYMAWLKTHGDEAIINVTETNAAIVDINAKHQDVVDAAAFYATADSLTDYRGAYEALVAYGIGNAVVYEGHIWVKLVVSAAGRTPTAYPDEWTITTSSLLTRRPIFDTITNSLYPIGGGEPILLQAYRDDYSNIIVSYLSYGNSLFLGSNTSTSSSATLRSSPDGVTWTARTAPTSATNVATGGTSLILLCARNTTSTWTTLDMVTFTPKTALPGVFQNTALVNPTFFSGKFYVPSATTSAYRSVDAVSWETVTLPITPTSKGGLFTVGDKIVICNPSTSNLYYSTTGSTGSWTTLALGFTLSSIGIFQSADGTLQIPTTTGAVYEFSGGTTVTYKYTMDSTSGSPFKIKGIYGYSYSGVIKTIHNGVQVGRAYTEAITPNGVLGGTTEVYGSGGYRYYFNATSVAAINSVFGATNV